MSVVLPDASRSGTRKFRAGGFWARDLADDRAVSHLGPGPRCGFVARRRGARMAGEATAVEGLRRLSVAWAIVYCLPVSDNR
jgi:hypothetical protein